MSPPAAKPEVEFLQDEGGKTIALTLRQNGTGAPASRLD
jgi:hypothetical protein